MLPKQNQSSDWVLYIHNIFTTYISKLSPVPDPAAGLSKLYFKFPHQPNNQGKGNLKDLSEQTGRFEG